MRRHPRYFQYPSRFNLLEFWNDGLTFQSLKRNSVLFPLCQLPVSRFGEYS